MQLATCNLTCECLKFGSIISVTYGTVMHVEVISQNLTRLYNTFFCTPGHAQIAVPVLFKSSYIKIC